MPKDSLGVVVLHIFYKGKNQQNHLHFIPVTPLLLCTFAHGINRDNVKTRQRKPKMMMLH